MLPELEGVVDEWAVNLHGRKWKQLQKVVLQQITKISDRRDF